MPKVSVIACGLGIDVRQSCSSLEGQAGSLLAGEARRRREDADATDVNITPCRCMNYPLSTVDVCDVKPVWLLTGRGRADQMLQARSTSSRARYRN
jgi:hypothetical protein